MSEINYAVRGALKAWAGHQQLPTVAEKAFVALQPEREDEERDNWFRYTPQECWPVADPRPGESVLQASNRAYYEMKRRQRNAAKDRETAQNNEGEEES